MPTILPPDEHLTAGLTAVQKHIDYHEGELAALRGLRRQYKDALGIVAGDRVHVEQTPAKPIRVVVPEGLGLNIAAGTAEAAAAFQEILSTQVAAITATEPTFDEVVSTMSGRIQQQ